MPTAAPRLVFLIPAVAAGLVVAAVVSLSAQFDLRIVVGAAAGLAAAAGVLVWLDRRASRAVLSAIGAQQLDAGSETRLESLVASMCASHGIAEPSLYLVDSQALDAAVVGRGNETQLVVTTGALRQLDRLELEAVIARQLAQSGAGVHAATTLASVGPLLGPLAKLVRRVQLDRQRLALTDVQGVLMTRYPPALAGAFQKAARGGGVAGTVSTRHLWMIGPLDGTAGVQPPLQDRIDALREL
ncbi:MAG: hypothetical protein OXN44_08125 [Acidimicrobiaceae bacterium]|nr:hypothetical protein [Acidimicrobiaceae bacterium]MDE0606785.1 hypothetical protein [Acidimicrobiaceae bacterium]MDE0607600.1 hypothetical protein [Acidimicrobiaceae bacterium]